jgi:hypothetical protein
MNSTSAPSAKTCTYCDKPAIEGGYIQPDMCPKHHSLAILISFLKNAGYLASLENLRHIALLYPPALLDPDEIEALLAPMKPEAVLNGEHS